MLYIIILLLSIISSFFAPWWMAGLIAFAASFFLSRSGKQAFWISFSAIFTCWLLLIVITLFTSQNLLLARMANLFSLPHPALVVLLSAGTGGLFAGLAGLSGRLVHAMFQVSAPKVKEKEKPLFVLPEFDLN
jgi:energy-coupling factor transporter transmembrane protein EcfT